MKRKRLFSVIAASALMLNRFSVPLNNVHAYPFDDDPYIFNFPEPESSDVWRFNRLESLEGVCDGPCIELVCYLGNHSVIVLPSEIDGLPVVSVKSHLIPQNVYQYGIRLYVPDSIKNFEEDWILRNGRFDLINELGDEYTFTYHSYDDYYNYKYDDYDDYDDYDYYDYNDYYDPYGNRKCYFTLIECYDRDTIEIPETCFGFEVEEIGNDALGDCTLAKELVIPDTVKYIAPITYSDFNNLRKIKFPSHINYIPNCFFTYLPKLEEVVWPEDLLFLAKGDLPEDSPVELPDVKLIYVLSENFNNYDPFYIYDRDTAWCYYIDPMTDSGEVEIILVYAPDLRGEPPTEYLGYPVEVALDETPPYGIPVINVPEDQTKLSLYYADTTHLEELNIASTDLLIESPGIPNSLIRELVFPGSVELCSSCFIGAHELKSVEFKGENSNIYINRCSFYSSSKLKTVTFPKAVKQLVIGEIAFQDALVENLVFPQGEVLIGANAFQSCSKLKDVIFSDDVNIQKYAFRSCKQLENVTFEGSAEMDRDVFENCPSLKNINIDINQPFNIQPFKGCTALETINGESPFNEDGSPKDEYKDFIEKNFYDAENNGIINKYVNYRVKELVAETITDDMTDIQKIKALHDKIGEMVYYDTDNIPLPKNHNDASIFLNDSSVCDGYARAMNLLLHEAGIDSCYVSNSDHAWVIVETGGHYFHVDPTWDDVGEIIYDWFMKTDDQIIHDECHSVWNIRQPSALHDFQWTELHPCTDKMGDVNNDDIIDARDASEILAGYAKASVGEETDLDPVLADFDYNGSVNAADASKVLKVYADSSANNGTTI